MSILRSWAPAIVGASVLCGGAFAGELDPPAGPVAPTMKTLDEVEPRIPISQENIPLLINEPGSYYLTGNLAAVNAIPAITIASDNVSLDLKGFTLEGTPNEVVAGDWGVMAMGRTNIRIVNGVIRNWRLGGVNAEGTNNSVFVDLRLEGNGWDQATPGYGIRANWNCVLERITAIGNGADGIRATRSVVKSCAAFMNGTNGILAPVSTVSDSIASNNAETGIVSGTGGIVVHCVAAFNGLDGIDAGFTGVVRDSSADNNDRFGIRVITQATVLNNRSHFNDVAGIYVSGDDNRIDGNNCLGNPIGVDVDSGGNLIVRNTVGDSSTSDYSIVGGNDVGTIQTSPVGAGPWDNMSY